MAAKKKALLITVIAVLAVVIVGSVSVTYAWFLSRYSAEYRFVLESESHVVLQYESDLTFASGSISDAGNKLVPAVSKSSAGLSGTVYEPMDMFDTSVVQTAASCAHYRANAAYWTGAGEDKGELSFALSAVVSGGNEDYDLVTWGEIDYIVIFAYKGDRILLYDGVYYTNEGNGDADFVLPTAVYSGAGMASWYEIADAEKVKTQGGVRYLLLDPNTEFEFDLYAFVAKTDELLDPAINGARIDFTARISVN